MRKNVKLTSLLMLLVVILIGCAPDSETDTGESAETTGNGEGQTLVVWEDQDKAIGIEDAVAAFEEEYNVTVEVIEKNYAQQIEDLRLDGPAGSGPDVLTMPADQLGTSVTEGLISELTLDEETKRIYVESALESQMIGDAIYGLPKAVETQILFYNKELIEESDLPQTTDEWYELSQEFNTSEQFAFLALWDQLYYAGGVIDAYGGYVFGQNEDGEYDPQDIGLNNDGAVEAAEYIQQFYADGIFPSGIVGEQGINMLDALFSEGKAAAVISGPWNVEPFTSAGIDFGVTELPLLPNGEHMGSFIGVKSYNVSSYSENKELAEEFIKFLTNEENSKVRYEKTLEVPAVASLSDDPIVSESEVATAIATQSQYAQVTPGITEMNSVWEPIDTALQTIANGSGNPQEALDSAVEQIVSTIQSLGQ